MIGIDFIAITLNSILYFGTIQCGVMLVICITSNGYRLIIEIKANAFYHLLVVFNFLNDLLFNFSFKSLLINQVTC